MMKSLIITILLTITLMNCRKSVEIKETNLNKELILIKNLDQAKIINNLPNQLINLYKNNKVISVELIDFDNSEIENYIVTYEKDNNNIEDWFSDDMKLINSYTVNGNIYKKWFQLKTSYFIRAEGYEDGVDFSYNTINNNKFYTLFYFNPIIKSNESYYYGYINNIEDLIVNNNKILASFEVILRDDNFSLAKEQVLLPNIVFKGNVDGNNVKEKLKEVNFFNIEDIIKKSRDNLVSRWQGIYYNEPYIDSIGSYYVTINPQYLNFGFSGSNEFEYKINLIEDNKDSLLLYNREDSRLLGTLIKKDNKFWIKSSLIDKGFNNQNGLFQLKYAKSANDVPD